MGPLRAFVIAGVLLLAVRALSADCEHLLPPDGSFDFARVTLRMNLGQADKERMLAAACDEYVLNDGNLLTHGRTKLQKAGGLSKWAQKNVLPTINQVDAVWSTLGNSAIEKEYKTKLAEIAKVADPDERVRRTYLLARKYQGNWIEKDSADGSGILGTRLPGEVLKKSNETGYGGVCRDFSSLLVWSLNQVSKSPVGIPRDQFQAEFTAYPGHALVTVKTFDNPNSRLAKAYSLDPTNYESFNPIPTPDLDSPKSKFDSRYEACIALRQCMTKPVESTQLQPGTR